MPKQWVGCLAVGLLAANVTAAGTGGAAFLDIPVGAAPAALGSAYTSRATDAYAPVYNPAGLSFLINTELGSQHLSYLESIDYEFLSVVHPFSPHHGIGASVQYLHTGDIDEFNASGTQTGEFSTHYAAYSLAYAYRIGEIGFGVTGKCIEAKLADVGAKTWALDVGVMARPVPALRLAAVVAQIGDGLEFERERDSLPLAVRFGGTYDAPAGIGLTLEGAWRKEGPAGFNTGIDWTLRNLLTFRAGYKTDTTDELSALAGFSTGIGAHFWNQELAYAWVPLGDLGDTHYLSLTLRFGEPRGRSNLQPTKRFLEEEVYAQK